MNVDTEARRLVTVFGPDRVPQLLSFLSSQLSVLKQQAQMVMGLSGLIVTVTGFSGQHMVAAGWLAAGPMIAGIAAVLVATVVTIRVLIRLRWVSQELADDLNETTAAVLRIRNAEQRALFRAGVFVAAGLSGYLIAVVVSALYAGGAL